MTSTATTNERVQYIGAGQDFARHLGLEVVSIAVDHVVLRLPYREFLGIERINGGAIASLVDLAGTCACWSATPRVAPRSGSPSTISSSRWDRI